MSEIKVILAENQDDPMLVLRESLKKNGLRVAVCTSGFDALDEIINEGGDVLVMAEHLPDISGFQLSCLIKATSVTSKLPIVLVSSGTGKEDNFWKRASLADSVLQRKHVEFSEDDSVKLIRRLAEAGNGSVTKERLEDQPVLSGEFTGNDLIKSYGELLNGLLAERLVHHFTQRLLATLPDRTELTSQFFDLMSRLFKPELAGLVVNTPLGPWSMFHLARPLNEEIVGAIANKANTDLGIAVPVASTIYGEMDKKGAKLKKAKVLTVATADGTKLGAVVVGWTTETDIDSVLKTALEHLRDQMIPVLQLMVAEDRYNLLHDQAQYWSTVDPITGLYNMEFFMGFLQQQLLFSQRQKLPVGLLILDIDGFVNINAQYGPETGNLLLKTLTARLSKSIRSSDLIARYGGDQFAIVLPNTDIAGAKLVAEKLKSEADGLNPSHEEAGKAPRVTISIGCAQFDFKDPTPEAVLKAAKDALNRAKEKGRNCISD